MKDLLPGAAAIRWWMESFQALAAAKTLDELVRRLPRGPLRRSLGTAAEVYHANPRPFFFEASLDNAYYAELLARAHALSFRRLPADVPCFGNGNHPQLFSSDAECDRSFRRGA